VQGSRSRRRGEASHNLPSCGWTGHPQCIEIAPRPIPRERGRALLPGPSRARVNRERLRHCDGSRRGRLHRAFDTYAAKVPCSRSSGTVVSSRSARRARASGTLRPAVSCNEEMTTLIVRLLFEQIIGRYICGATAKMAYQSVVARNEGERQ